MVVKLLLSLDAGGFTLLCVEKSEIPKSGLAIHGK